MWIEDPFRGDPSGLRSGLHHSHAEFGDWFVKLKTTAPNEIAGYQLATQIGVGVMESRWFVADRPLNTDYASLKKGDLGLLIRKIDHAEADSIESLAKRDPSAAARILSLFVFDRGEWPEINRVAGQVRLIDLEMMMAKFYPRVKLREDRLREYTNFSTSSFQEAAECAEKNGIENEFRAEISAFSARLNAGAIHFDFQPHRRGDLMADYFLAAVTARTEVAARELVCGD